MDGLHRLLRHLVDRHRLEFLFLDSARGQMQAVHQIPGVHGRGDDLVNLLQNSGLHRVHLEQLCRPQDAGQDVVQVVTDSRGQLA